MHGTHPTRVTFASSLEIETSAFELIVLNCDNFYSIQCGPETGNIKIIYSLGITPLQRGMAIYLGLWDELNSPIIAMAPFLVMQADIMAHSPKITWTTVKVNLFPWGHIQNEQEAHAGSLIELPRAVWQTILFLEFFLHILYMVGPSIHRVMQNKIAVVSEMLWRLYEPPKSLRVCKVQ